MSKFLTSITVDVESVRKLLPAKAFQGEIRFNPALSTIEILWEDDNLVTPFTFATEFPLEALKERKIPAGVKLRKQLAAEKSAAEKKHKTEQALFEENRRKAAEERSAARKKVAIKNAEEQSARTKAASTGNTVPTAKRSEVVKEAASDRESNTVKKVDAPAS